MSSLSWQPAAVPIHYQKRDKLCCVHRDLHLHSLECYHLAVYIYTPHHLQVSYFIHNVWPFTLLHHRFQ